MLDEIEKIATDLLSLSKDEVRRVREALLVEVAQDDARYAARTALSHPEGSTTPLNDAADRSQQTYTKVRARMMKALPDLLALILAEQVAKQKRDEAAEARNRHWAAEHERRAVGPHPETRDLFARLFKHGVTPWHLKALRDEDVAIIADLIRWKANDARYKNADTPWRSVLRLYANRLILQPDHGVTVKKSAPGTPVRGKRYTSPNYYMFNEMVEPGWETGLVPFADEVNEPEGNERPDDIPSDSGEKSIASTDTLGNEKAIPGAKGAETLGQAETPNSVAKDLCASGGSSVPEPVARATEPREIGDVRVRPEVALPMARVMCEFEHHRMQDYWPTDLERGDFEPSRLIPALERMAAGSENWIGIENFLTAARRGEARDFFERRLAIRAEKLAEELADGDRHAIDAARRLGLIA